MSMTPEHRLDLSVQVLVDGCWHPGFLEHRRRRGEDWEGFVRWTEGPGITRIGWYGFELLRPDPAIDMRADADQRWT